MTPEKKFQIWLNSLTSDLQFYKSILTEDAQAKAYYENAMYELGKIEVPAAENLALVFDLVHRLAECLMDVRPVRNTRFDAIFRK